MARVGRPSKLTPAIKDLVLDAISIGASQELAAQYAGISQGTIQAWLRRGKEERSRIEGGDAPDMAERKYLKFLLELEEAGANAAISWQQVLDNAARSDPAWAIRMLKIRFPEGYQETSELQVSGSIDTNLTAPADFLAAYETRRAQAAEAATLIDQDDDQ